MPTSKELRSSLKEERRMAKAAIREMPRGERKLARAELRFETAKARAAIKATKGAERQERKAHSPAPHPVSE